MAAAPCKFQNRFFCKLDMIKRILSLRVILPTQCFVVAVWELGIGIKEMVVSRRAFISSSSGDD